MKFRIHILCAAVVFCAVFAGCKSNDYEDGTPLANAAYIDAAELTPDSRVTIRKDLSEIDREFMVKLTSPAPSDMKVFFKVDDGAVSAYNQRHGTSYELLPDQYYSFTQQEVGIGQGDVVSPPVVIHFSGIDQMELNHTYLFPVSLTGSSSDVGLLKGSETVHYLVKRSSAITTAADLTDSYMWIPSYETPEGQVALKKFQGVTYEAIVNIKEFLSSVNVTTVMGVEEHLLMRIGDRSYPRQQIQIKAGEVYYPANSKDYIVPGLKLNPGEWYHLAFSWDIDAAKGRIYVNGQLQHESTLMWPENDFGLNMLTTGGLEDIGRRFFIGYSYNPHRSLYGMISEVRIWSVARTQEEIFRDMYEVPDPASKPELRAYWRFDEGSGNVVKDHSQYGNDAYCLAGTNDFEGKERTEGNLRWDNSIEIPMLNIDE